MEEKQTHVEVNEVLNTPQGKINILKDTGFVESYDFSRANLNTENRIGAITKVASICYQSPKAAGSINLFNRLQAESSGLPSSSFEFVPMLFTQDQVLGMAVLPEYLNIVKFGEWICNKKYLLTNYRAAVYDFEEHGELQDYREFFNTEEDCEIIKEHFKVFLYNVDLSTRAQMVRHRINWQELSRRYVSGKKKEFTFYVSDKMEQIVSNYGLTEPLSFDTSTVMDICLNHYYAALDQGVKPEEARRILPQAMMTQIWGAYQPSQLENFFRLRLDTHAQKEIRKVAEAMESLI